MIFITLSRQNQCGTKSPIPGTSRTFVFRCWSTSSRGLTPSHWSVNILGHLCTAPVAGTPGCRKLKLFKRCHCHCSRCETFLVNFRAMFFEQDIQNHTLKTTAEKINLKEISSHLFGRERFLELAKIDHAFGGIGHGGEVKFISRERMMFDNRFHMLFAQWFQRKTLKTTLTALVPCYNHPESCSFLSFGCHWACEGGLLREHGIGAPGSSLDRKTSFVFQDLHNMRNQFVLEQRQANQVGNQELQKVLAMHQTLTEQVGLLAEQQNQILNFLRTVSLTGRENEGGTGAAQTGLPAYAPPPPALPPTPAKMPNIIMHNLHHCHLTCPTCPAHPACAFGSSSFACSSLQHMHPSNEIKKRLGSVAKGPDFQTSAFACSREHAM